MAKTTYLELNNQLNIPTEDGRIQVDKDKEAVRKYFIEHVNQNTVFFHSLREQIDFLIEEDYIDEKIINKYDFGFIESLFSFLYSKKFRFKTFMGANKFYKQYALKTNDGERYLERYEDRIAYNALMMGNGDEELAINIANEIINQRMQPATPTFLNAGRKQRGELVSCFLIQPEDSMNSIGRSINNALQLSRIGGGVGINLSALRAAGDPIKNIENAASGVVPVMKLYEDSFSYSNQLGQRQGAGVTYLNVFHPDIEQFLSTKKENADEKIRMKTLSLGIIVPDKFYELTANDEYMRLFSPYDVEREYGVSLAYLDITKEYDNMVANPRIKKRIIKARDLEEEIGKLQQESGYPYILNIDTANRDNAIKGRITMSNLCSEILQVQEPSEINNAQEYKIIGKDISCNLASTNIPNHMRAGREFGRSVRTMVRALTYVTDDSFIDTVPSVARGNDESHAIGLGAMGLHQMFAENEMEYGSPESLEFVDAYFTLLNYWTLVESNTIARERGVSFTGFGDSKYADGSYFKRYNKEEFSFKFDKVAELFKDIGVPSIKDWNKLAENVAQYGLYHQNRLAVAPNGSISYINETTASLHPITQLIEERQEKKIGKTYYPAPSLSDKTLPYYTSAYDMDMRKVIDVYATAQKHIDQALSLTLFMRSDIKDGLYEWKNGRDSKQSTRDLTLLRHYAWKKGIKTIYYVRTHTDDDNVIGANQCESCVI